MCAYYLFYYSLQQLGVLSLSEREENFLRGFRNQSFLFESDRPSCNPHCGGIVYTKVTQPFYACTDLMLFGISISSPILGAVGYVNN